MSRFGMLRAQSVVRFSAVGLALLGSSAHAQPPKRSWAAASLASTGEPEANDGEPGPYSPRTRERWRRFQLGLGTGVTWGLGDVWEGRGDVIENQGTVAFVDLSIAPSYRVVRDLALGVRAGVGFDPGSRGQISSPPGDSVSIDRRLWHVSALGRYQPEPGRGWYIALSAGAAAIVDSKGNASTTQWAPLLGAAAGYDVSLGQALSIGLELRAAHAEFGEGSHTSFAGFYDYRVSTWLGAGIVVNILP